MPIIVENMQSSKGNDVPNQFILKDGMSSTFQSYKSIIAKVLANDTVLLDKTYWNYSKTTSKYLAIFLGIPGKVVKEKVKSGEFELVDLNS